MRWRGIEDHEGGLGGELHDPSRRPEANKFGASDKFTSLARPHKQRTRPRWPRAESRTKVPHQPLPRATCRVLRLNPVHVNHPKDIRRRKDVRWHIGALRRRRAPAELLQEGSVADALPDRIERTRHCRCMFLAEPVEHGERAGPVRKPSAFLCVVMRVAGLSHFDLPELVHDLREDIRIVRGEDD